ncbi:hypothetical protein Poly24_30790 [Rosistilla carotiformis]|uniref:Legionella pneumophila major outer membrane protein n=1 Tax=Rosistilla carotiformis TaxID=2528017 RepID=A0A518JUZ1_9BACT|nr:BBP7 family outer membrane beta-barrel protein [Rosistilla carotiformis]QDV69364.1 hypothetical protein Poly24_30790 [Rosistilla carotiformis]
MVIAAPVHVWVPALLILMFCFLQPRPVTAVERDHAERSPTSTLGPIALASAPETPPKILGLETVSPQGGPIESSSDVPSMEQASSNESLPPPAPFSAGAIPNLTELEANTLENYVLTEAQLQALLAPSRTHNFANAHGAKSNTCSSNTCPSPNQGQTPRLIQMPPDSSETDVSIARTTTSLKGTILAAPCPPRCWVAADVLMLWLQGDTLPPLLTTSIPGTPQADAGRLVLPTTTSLFGGEQLDSEARFGGRLNIGRWLQRADGIAWETEFSFLKQEDANYRFDSAGNPTLARPFYDVNPGIDAEAADLVAFDPLVAGRMTIDTRSELYTGSVGMRTVGMRWSNPEKGRELHWLSGFRYFRLAESVRIGDQRLVGATHASPYGTLDAGTTLDSFDLFKTENDFYGFDLGLSAQRTGKRLGWRAQAKVALGVNHQAIDAAGERTITPLAGAAATENGGLLTGEGNLGEASRQRFAILPEARFEVGYRLTSHLRATVGYQFLYLNEAVRPGAQIDRAANSSLLDAAVADAGPTRPGQLFESESVYVHGGTFGLEFHY